MTNILKSLIDKVNAAKANAVNDLKMMEAGIVSRLTLYIGTNWHPIALASAIGFVAGFVLARLV